MLAFAKRFLADESGLETVEYAVILGLIVAATITAIGVLAGWVTDQFEGVNGILTPAAPGGS